MANGRNVIPETNVQFGVWLRKKREEAGLDAKSAAIRAGLGRRYLWEGYESGVTTARRSRVVELAKVVGADSMEALRVAGYESQSEESEKDDRRSVWAAANDPDLPHAIRSAALNYNRMMAVDHDFPDAEMEISINRTSYLDTGPIKTLQDRVGEYIRSEFKLPEQASFEFTFDVIFQRAQARQNKFIYPFPFFLTGEREETWGVIPYGHHRSVGLVIHPDNKAFKKLEKLDPKQDQGLPAWIPAETNWIEWLLNDIKGLYSVIAYIHQELIPALTRQSDFRHLASKWSRCDRSRRDLTIALTDFKREASGTDKCDLAMIFDLADRDDIKAEVGTWQNGYEILAIPHGLPIPVGIGFSLHMLPDLLKPDAESGVPRWQALAKLAREILWPRDQEGKRREGIRKLALAGIEFDPFLLP